MDTLAHKRQQILQEMEQIERMELGSLQSDARPSKRHPDCDCGPYFKHQVWAEGQNLTRRIPAEEAPALAEAIAERKRFEKLAGEFIDTTVAMTRSKSPGSKKNESKSRRPSRRKHPD